jgi:hypothetical protein
MWVEKLSGDSDGVSVLVGIHQWWLFVECLLPIVLVGVKVGVAVGIRNRNP